MRPQRPCLWPCWYRSSVSSCCNTLGALVHYKKLLPIQISNFINSHSQCTEFIFIRFQLLKFVVISTPNRNVICNFAIREPKQNHFFACMAKIHQPVCVLPTFQFNKIYSTNNQQNESQICHVIAFGLILYCQQTIFLSVVTFQRTNISYYHLFAIIKSNRLNTHLSISISGIQNRNNSLASVNLQIETFLHQKLKRCHQTFCSDRRRG